MSDLILIGALLITIFLRVQICRLAAFIILLPFKNFLSPSFKVPMLRFLLLALPLIITGITLFSYNSSSSASIFSHTDTISMEKEEPLSNTITDNGITEDSLLKSAQASSSTHTNSAEKNSADNDSAQKYSADETSDKLSAHTLAARNVSPVFTVDISNTSAASIISIWISVSIILLTIVLVNRIRTNLLLKRAYINKKKEWKKAISALKRKGYDCRKTRLYSVPFWNESPFSFGCLRSSIIVPETSVSWNSEQKQAVLLHEMQHIQGHDLLTGLALDIMNALFWPCALGKFLERQLEQAQEERCDMYAVRSVCHPLEYADLLLNFAYSPNSYVLPGAQGYAGKSSITRRINMIVTNLSASGGKKKRVHQVLLSTAMLGCIVLALVFASPLIYAKPAATEAAQAPLSIPAETGVETDITVMGVRTPGSKVENFTLQKDILPGLWPVAENPGHLSMSFGFNVHPITGQVYLHKGVDISNWRAGDPLIATMDSVVYRVDYDQDYGNHVVLKKGNVLVIYAHLKDFSVKAGDTVKAGTTIGHIGNTGISTAPHLHYGVFIYDDTEAAEIFSVSETESAGSLFHGGYWIDALPLMITPKA
jgi:murein DD-endopeptidase MepM/ murein hydrolase activator NlpD